MKTTVFSVLNRVFGTALQKKIAQGILNDMKFPVILLLPLLLWSTPLYAQTVPVRPITFPVNGEYAFRNDWHEPRGGGTRLHIGTDIIAAKMTPLVAVVDGYVNYVARPQAPWGYEISLQDAEGYTYSYLHINNDTPGTDDGAGGETYAYVSGVHHGATVSKGQLIGWVGDSGNAETTVPHVHFEMRDPNHVVFNPYPSLAAASGGKGISTYTPSINTVESNFEQRKVELRYIFTKTLSVGSESSEVKQLQMTLRAFGLFTHPSDTGYFGEVTRAAVVRYQLKKMIPQTGIVDAAMREKLNDDLGTYDPNLYKPYYSDAEARAIQIQKLLQMIAVLQKQLTAIQGRAQ